MRLFIAVTPDERFREALSAALDPWRERLPVRWTRPGQWHVTLQFLGEWPEERVPGLREALAGVAGRPAFTVRPGGLGAFPDGRRPRVLFVHLDGGEDLVGLAGSVRERVDRTWPGGPQDGKAFRAHLTLARVREPLSAEAVKTLDSIDLGDLPGFGVAGFELVASELGARGATHRTVAFWRLRKKGE